MNSITTNLAFIQQNVEHQFFQALSRHVKRLILLLRCHQLEQGKSRWSTHPPKSGTFFTREAFSLMECLSAITPGVTKRRLLCAGHTNVDVSSLILPPGPLATVKPWLASTPTLVAWNRAPCLPSVTSGLLSSPSSSSQVPEHTSVVGEPDIVPHQLSALPGARERRSISTGAFTQPLRPVVSQRWLASLVSRTKVKQGKVLTFVLSQSQRTSIQNTPSTFQIQY